MNEKLKNFFNADEALRNNPKTKEYHEAIQDKLTQERQQMINSLPPKDKKNFLFVEKIVGELEKRSLPFLIVTNPFGFSFSPEGFWRYQSFAPKSLDPFSEEGKKQHTRSCYEAMNTLFIFFSLVFNSKITMSNRRGMEIVYENGRRIK